MTDEEIMELARECSRACPEWDGVPWADPGVIAEYIKKALEKVGAK